jgi:hypothetical protein
MTLTLDLDQGTGMGLDDVFVYPHSRERAHAYSWRGGSVTMALHVRTGLNAHGVAAGLLTGGTASGDERWAGELVAARGRMTVLDSVRITEDGERVALGVPDEPVRVVVSVALTAALWVPELDAAEAETIDNGDPGGDEAADGGELERLARAMTEVPAAVVVERPVVPELSDQPLENVRRLFDLTAGQLADLFGVTERQMRRYLRNGLPEARRPLADALVAVGLTVIGGLGARGAQRWLFSGQPTSAQLAVDGRVDELADRAEALRDSPAT